MMAGVMDEGQGRVRQENRTGREAGAARRASAWLLHCSLLACALPWQAHALAAEAAQKPTLLVLGDSLSAEYGLARGSGWVACW
jgi:acyl-CoA thioesterase-1